MQRDELLRLLLDRRGAILGWIATVLHDRAAGEDVFQEALVRAHDRAELFDHPGHAMAWIRSTARNLALNEARKAHRRGVELDERAIAALDRHWAARDAHADRDELDRLEACVQRLGPTARTMLRLRFADGLPGERIAASLGKTAAAVHTAFSRIYRALAACMRHEQPA
jgi:RNA polymerase sigma-70 factor, ECF subfamily